MDIQSAISVLAAARWMALGFVIILAVAGVMT